jgi:hypothetical protein
MQLYRIPQECAPLASRASFDEVKAQCLPFPDKGAKVEQMIDWVDEEVKAVPDIVW